VCGLELGHSKASDCSNFWVDATTYCTIIVDPIGCEMKQNKAWMLGKLIKHGAGEPDLRKSLSDRMPPKKEEAQTVALGSAHPILLKYVTSSAAS
jgi:hypothetical protein